MILIGLLLCLYLNFVCSLPFHSSLPAPRVRCLSLLWSGSLLLFSFRGNKHDEMTRHLYGDEEKDSGFGEMQVTHFLRLVQLTVPDKDYLALSSSRNNNSSSSASASGLGSSQQDGQSAVYLSQINKSPSLQAKYCGEFPVCTLTHCHPHSKSCAMTTEQFAGGVSVHSDAVLLLISGLTVWLCALSNDRSRGWKREEAADTNIQDFPSFSALSHSFVEHKVGQAGCKPKHLVICRMSAESTALYFLQYALLICLFRQILGKSVFFFFFSLPEDLHVLHRSTVLWYCAKYMLACALHYSKSHWEVEKDWQSEESFCTGTAFTCSPKK